MNSKVTLVHGMTSKEVDLNNTPHLVVVSPDKYTLRGDIQIHDGDTADLTKIVESMHEVHKRMEDQKVANFESLRGGDNRRHVVTFSDISTVKDKITATADPNSPLATILKTGRSAGYDVIINAKQVDETVNWNPNLTVLKL